MNKDEALRLALEFVEANHSGGPDAFELIDIIKVALEAKDEPVGWFGYDSTLGGWFETNEGDDDSIPLYKAPPKQEAKDDPVAWLKVSETLGGFGKFVEAKPNEKGAKPVYTTPPQRTWEGLTEEEIDKCDWGQSERDFARAIEDKLRSKNT